MDGVSGIVFVTGLCNGSCEVFFFKQKTAYEMVSRDWSSDVCSSDLKHYLNHLSLVVNIANT